MNRLEKSKFEVELAFFVFFSVDKSENLLGCVWDLKKLAIDTFCLIKLGVELNMELFEMIEGFKGNEQYKLLEQCIFFSKSSNIWYLFQDKLIKNNRGNIILIKLHLCIFGKTFQRKIFSRNWEFKNLTSRTLSRNNYWSKQYWSKNAIKGSKNWRKVVENS